MSTRALGELIEGAAAAASVEDVHSLCSTICDELGFDHFIYGAQFPTSLVKPQMVIISGYPEDWRTHYNAAGYLHIDPTIAHCRTRITPLIWDQIAPDSRRGARPAQQFMAEAHDFGLKSGASFPVHGCHGELAMLSFASTTDTGGTAAQIAEALPHAHLMASYVHEAVRRIFESAQIPLGKVSLTARERECLLWAAEGKTTWEIALILHISERTVIFHLQNVTTKLNVSNRQQAVARAISQALIRPQLN